MTDDGQNAMFTTGKADGVSVKKIQSRVHLTGTVRILKLSYSATTLTALSLLESLGSGSTSKLTF